MSTYSFVDVTATLTGVGGSIDLGYGSATSEEGISTTMSEDKNTMTTGADGEVMHSLHASKTGQITVRLLKTSPTNAKLMKMYLLQQSNGASWGQNIIIIRNNSSNDTITGRSAAFKRIPDMTYAKEAGVVEWSFDVGKIDALLGEYA